MKNKFSLMGTALLASCVSSFAAQTPASLGEMVVRSESTKSPLSTQKNLAEMTAAARKIPGGVEVISPERLAKGRATNLADTLFLSPGVVAQSRFGSDEARISIRGSGIQRTFHGRGISVLQDGIPVNLADGSFDMQSLDPLMASSIEVFRGANALRLGATTLGGAINYTSYSGKNFPNRAEIGIDAGSYGFARAQIRSGFQQGKVDGFVSLQTLRQDGFRDHAEQQSVRLFSNLGYQISENAETRFYFTQILSHSELPGNLTLQQLRENPRQAAANNLTLDQQRNYSLTRLANRTAWQVENHQFEIFSAYTSKDLDHPIFQVIDQYSNDFTIGGRSVSQFDFAGFSHESQLGFLWTYGEISAAQFSNVLGNRGSLLTRGTQTAQNFQLFALHDLAFTSQFHGIFGTSWANTQRRSASITKNFASFDESDSQFSPQAGFRYELTKNVEFFANGSANYEPASFSEAVTIQGANRAQTGLTFEAGTRGRYLGSKWELALYQSNLKNELLAIDHDNNPATPALTVNADRTIHRGIELGTEIDFLHLADDESSGGQHIFWRQAYTYGDFRFDNDAKYGNNRLAGLPPQLIRGEFLWQNSHGYYAGPTYEWSPSKTFIDHRNTTAAPSYAIAGFKLGQRKQSGFSWYLELRNLTNRRFAATTGVIEDAQSRDQAQFLPGEGRTVYAGVNYAW